MRNYAIFFLIIFSSFIVTPFFVTLAGGDVNVSNYFNANEEEHPIKIKEVLYDASELFTSNLLSIEFLKIKKQNFNIQFLIYKNVSRDVLSPPPKFS